MKYTHRKSCKWSSNLNFETCDVRKGPNENLWYLESVTIIFICPPSSVQIWEYMPIFIMQWNGNLTLRVWETTPNYHSTSKESKDTSTWYKNTGFECLYAVEDD